MKIAIGSDHVGSELKPIIMEYLTSKGHEVHDFGTYSTESTDYPIYGVIVGEAVAQGDYEQGILICGTGIGISLAANKVKGIRACACSEPYSAQMARRHNNANVLCFGARVVGSEMAKMIVDAWLEAEFEGGRHARRVKEIVDYENGTWRPEDGFPENYL